MKTYREKWEQWQQSVVITVRCELGALFASVQHKDFDWDAWRSLYDKGYSPQLAVNEAFSRPSIENRQRLPKRNG